MTQGKIIFQPASCKKIIEVFSIPSKPVNVANVGTFRTRCTRNIYNEGAMPVAHYILGEEKMTRQTKNESSKMQKAKRAAYGMVLCAARDPFAKGFSPMRKPRTKKDSFRIAETKAKAKESHAIASGFEYCEIESIDFGSLPVIPVTIESESAKRYTKTFLPDPEQVTLSQLIEAVDLLTPQLSIAYGSANNAVTRYAARAFKTDFRNAIAASMTREVSPLTMLRRIVADKSMSAAEKQARAMAIVASLIPDTEESDD